MKQLISKTYKIAFYTTVMVMAIGCKVEPIQTLPTKNYDLVWNDEFDGDSGTAPSDSKWTYDIGTGQNGWGNNELQSYTNNSKNISKDGLGHLVITAIKDGSGNYTSARIKTEGLFSQQYRRIKAHIKTPTGSGIWPAFWMLGSNIKDVGWPQCGEIDIMEQKGKFSNITYGTLHGPGYSGGEAISTAYGLQNDRFDMDFNIYAVEWDENQIDFYVNNYLYKRVKPSDIPGEWVFNQPFFIIMNVAVGGNFVGPPNINTPFPCSMYIDYIRVYKEL
jgi:beta-glucanase (GH16 family)